MGGGEQKNVSIKKKRKNGSFKSIFMHADVLDWFLMAFGSFGAIGDGIMVPMVLLSTSKIMNSIGGFSGQTSSNFVHNINKVISFSLAILFFVTIQYNFFFSSFNVSVKSRVFLKLVLYIYYFVFCFFIKKKKEET